MSPAAAAAAAASASASASSLHPHFVSNLILAPLTRGGNLPFRRLCADFGMEVGVGEMVFARYLLRGDPVESARLRRASNERVFGVQIATNCVEEGGRAIDAAVDAGADFVDLNCGCPIHEATRRGLGSAMLRNPSKLGRLIEGLAERAARRDVPFTAKVRLGCEEDDITVLDVAREVAAARGAGVAALTVHGRTARQGYSRPADWGMISNVVRELEGSGVAVVGNGDVHTASDARRMMEETGVDSVMAGRSALSRPWIFQDYARGYDWNPDVRDRVGVYRTLALYMKDHFGDDAKGRKMAWNFYPWHFDFLRRENGVGAEEEGRDVSPLEYLLSHRSPEAHELIADAIWGSDSDSNALHRLNAVAEGSAFGEIQAKGTGMENREEEEEEAKELANIPTSEEEKEKDDKYKWRARKRRTAKPRRTPEEIERIRAERAVKRDEREAKGIFLVHQNGKRRSS